MPRGDGTGPAGMGPMTGRAAGYCAGYPAPGFMNPVGGRGLGMAWGRGGGFGRGMGMAWGRGGGFGMGMAWRRGRGGGFGFAPGLAAPYAAPMPFAPPTREQELEALRGQADWLKEQMDAITRRIQEQEKQPD